VNEPTSHLRRELTGIAVFVGIIWVVFIANWLVFPTDFNSFGLTPRTLIGAVGIVTMPFLHADWGHLVSNTVPLLVLLALLVGSKARSWETVGEIILAGGVLLWLFGRSATHVGASSLIFGLVAFLMISGFLERRFIPLIVSLLVGFFYGGTLFWGVLPIGNSGISWDGHLCGAVAGGLLAWLLTRPGRTKTDVITGSPRGVD
jgi:membrane associated rhomboid family serine protease